MCLTRPYHEIPLLGMILMAEAQIVEESKYQELCSRTLQIQGKTSTFFVTS